MIVDQTLDLLQWIADRRGYRRTCHISRPADEAAEDKAERQALAVLDAMRITANAYYSMIAH